jgi:hypothetical protein
MPISAPATEGSDAPENWGPMGTGCGVDATGELWRIRRDLEALQEAYEDLRQKYNAHTHLCASHTHVENTAGAYTQNAVTNTGGNVASAAPAAGAQSTIALVLS